jgi:hypothetical protein
MRVAHPPDRLLAVSSEDAPTLADSSALACGSPPQVPARPPRHCRFYFSHPARVERSLHALRPATVPRLLLVRRVPHLCERPLVVDGKPPRAKASPPPHSWLVTVRAVECDKAGHRYAILLLPTISHVACPRLAPSAEPGANLVAFRSVRPPPTQGCHAAATAIRTDRTRPPGWRPDGDAHSGSERRGPSRPRLE